MNSRNLNNKKICYKKGLIAVAHFLQNRKQGHSYYHTLVLFVLISPTCLPLNNAKNGHPSYRELMVGKKEPKNFSNLFLQIHHIFFFFHSCDCVGWNEIRPGIQTNGSKRSSRRVCQLKKYSIY